MLTFIEKDLAGEKISIILKTLLNLADGLKNPQELYFNIILLRACGLWVRNEHEKKDLLINCLMSIPTIFITGTFFVNMVSVITNLAALVENLSGSFLNMYIFYLAFVFLTNRKTYVNFVNELIQLNKDFPTDNESILMERKIRFLSTCLVVYNCCGSGYYVITPYLTKSFCSQTGATICGLPLPGTFPYDATSGTGFWISYLIQTMSVFQCVFIATCGTFYVGCIFLHLSAHLIYLKRQIGQICQNCTTDGESMLRMKKFLRHHSAVLCLGNKVMDSFKKILIFFGSIPIILSILLCQCILMFLDMKATNSVDINLLRVILYFNAWCIVLLAACLLGEHISNISTDIAIAFYDIPWYHQSLMFQDYVYVVMLRSQKPLTLRTTLNDFNLEFFKDIMSKTYTLMTVLINVLAK